MPELSNLLRQRLGAAENGPLVHPDADTLTAYVEQLLPAPERQQVLTHLSACGQCREVLALSQAELPELAAQTVIQPAPVSRWRRLLTPAFGMAATVAAMAVIAVVVLQLPHNPGPQPQTAHETKAAPLSDQKAAISATPAAPAPSEEGRAASAREADNLTRGKDRDISSRLGFVAGAAVAGKIASSAKKEAPRQPAAAAQPVLTAGLTKQDFINTGIFAGNATDNVVDGQSSNDLPPTPQPQPSSLSARFNAKAPGPITVFSDIPPNASGNKPDVRLMTPPPPPDHFGCTVCKIVEKGARSVLRHTPGTTPAISSNGLTFSAMGGQGKFSADLQKSEPAAVAAVPEKTGGAGLEQSDGLTGRSMSAASFASAESAPAPWRVVGGKLVKSTGPSQSQTEDAYPGATFQFSFVSARGNEVWAGGTHASLIHSRDGGNHWETVRLGDAASGAIANILFSGNHVQVKTSDDQTWSSADGGKSWVLQASQN
jgi:hypothetical protein